MSDHNPLTLKLNLWEKIAYGMGDVGSNLMLSIGTLYLLKFYTDELGMPAYYGGIIFLVAKFFTAFTDMLTGFLLDSRKNIGPKGKFRPFILYAAVPAALIATLQFIATTFREGANKRGNSSRLTQSFHFFMFESIFSPVNALNQPI
ncbi:MFS/sugar transport family protein [Escherichia coli 2-011-08_S1_C3]|nr:MFS/sugar transport family protein [Escherichia coli 2-011-08_S1_C3]